MRMCDAMYTLSDIIAFINNAICYHILITISRFCIAKKAKLYISHLKFLHKRERKKFIKR